MADHMANKDAQAKVPRPTIDPEPSPREGMRNFAEAGPRPRTEAEASQARGSSEGDPARRGAGSVERAREGVRSWLHETFPGHENAVLWGFVGFLVALLFFIIGFWRTLVVVLLVVVGVAFGQVLDGDPKIVNTVRGLFGGDDAR